MQALDPLRVFLSSVLDENTRDARQACVRVLPRGIFRAWTWENTPASSESPRESYLEGVTNSHLLIWLVSDRTSTAVKEEVGLALDREIPILAFRLPVSARDASTEKLFKRVRTVAKTVDVADVLDLENQLSAALNDMLIRTFLTGSDHVRRLAYAQGVYGRLRGRAIARWLAARVPIVKADELFGDGAVGALPGELRPTGAAPLRVLVGDFGGGKTLAAIRFLLEAAQAMLTEPLAPIPVWIGPETPLDDLDAVVAAMTSTAGDFRTSGVVIVVDAIDERVKDPPQAVLEKVRALIHANPASRGLITTRPGVYRPGEVPEVAELDQLTQEGSVQLINRVFGTQLSAFDIQMWGKPVRDAVRRPMFALLVGRLRVRDPRRRITGVGQLIEALVTAALGSDADGLSTNNLLMHLARQSIDAGGDPVPQGDVGNRIAVREAIGTRLVVPVGQGLTFALAILREWFGAQSLGSGLTSIDHVTSDEQQLERWRYALYVAVGTLPKAIVDQLLERLARVSPGLVSDVISEASAGWSMDEDVTQREAADIGSAYLKAIRALSDGIGDAGHLVFPWIDRDTLAQLRVGVAGRYAVFDWRLPEANEPELIEIDYEGASGPNPPGRLRASWFGYSSEPLWPWSHARNDLRDMLKANLEARSFYVVSMLPEANWLAATWITRRGVRCDPIPAEDIRQALRGLDPFGSIKVRNKLVALAPLHKAVEGIEELRCPYPDRDQPLGGWVWDGFSDEVLLERARMVYTFALTIYEDLVRYYFEGFRERFEHAVLLPARLVATVHPKTDETRGPGITYYFEPLPASATSEVSIALGPETRDRWDRVDELAELLPKRRPKSPWVHASVRSGRLDVAAHDAATQVAEDWLRHDLIAVRWAK